MKPMLAATMQDVGRLKFPVLASPKLDGVRALVMNGVVMSRNFKPIPNQFVQELWGNHDYDGFDGELIVGEPWGKDCYRDTVSGVMKQSGQPAARFFAFDNYLRPLNFEHRILEVEQRIAALRKYNVTGSDEIVHVRHTLVSSEEELNEFEQQCLGAGYEGIMVRSLNGPYKHGRSTENEGYLLKVKRFCDCEAEVVGFDEQFHNGNELTRDELGRAKRTSHKENKTLKGTLGALKVEGLNGPYEGVLFDVGTGFTDAERQEIWNNKDSYFGKVAKVKYFPTGSKDKPRFPTFLGWRPKGA